MVTSKIWRDRFVSEAIGRLDETRSRRLQTQKVAAGSPNSAAIENLDAWGNQDERNIVVWINSLMSHQIGIGLLTFPAQTITLTETITHHPNNHHDNAMVAILRARICRGRGMSASIAAIKPNVGGVVYNIDANRSAGERGKEVKNPRSYQSL